MNKSNGLSLLEMLIALTIVTLIGMWGMSAWRDQMLQTRQRTLAMHVFQMLQDARLRAILNGKWVGVNILQVPTGASQIMTYYDNGHDHRYHLTDQLIKRIIFDAHEINLSTNLQPPNLTFNHMGFLQSPPGRITFAIAGHPELSAINIIVSLSGRVRMETIHAVSKNTLTPPSPKGRGG